MPLAKEKILPSTTALEFAIPTLRAKVVVGE